MVSEVAPEGSAAAAVAAVLRSGSGIAGGSEALEEHQSGSSAVAELG